MKKIVLGGVIALAVLAVRAERIELKTDCASCVVETRGARIMSFKPRLSYADGRISAYVSTEDWAVGVADVSVDGKVPENVRKVQLVPFEDEDNTLTYFRAPNLNETVKEDDELFGATSGGGNLPF